MKLRLTKNLAAVACATVAVLPCLAQTDSPLGKLPLFFETNHGQSQSPAAFLARTADAQCAISASGMEMDLRNTSGQTSRLQMNFVGANPSAQIHGDAELSGKVNYLVGNDQTKWQSGVPTFAKVRVEKIYPGVDVVFYGNNHQLEYDFIFAPGASPGVVALRFEGAEKIKLGAEGELVVSVGKRAVHQPQPLIYQTVNGTRQIISGGYKILPSQTVAFNIGDYDHSLPLVIDPILQYSTFLGGNSGDTAWAVAINPNDGSVYVAGQTFSTQFSTPGAYQANYRGGSLAGDAFVARLDASGTNLIYLTYLGGSSDDAAYGLAVDGAGNAYVCGATDSKDFPIMNAIPGGTNIHGIPDAILNIYPSDAIVAELDAGGSNLIYSTYLGAESYEAAYGIAIDPAGNAFVTGFTYSTNFPGTANTSAYQPYIGCKNNAFTFHFNAFVTEIAAGGHSLKYSTYLGGTNADSGRAIAYNNHQVFVAGYTTSTNFPNTNAIAGFQYLNGSSNTINLSYDAFVAAFTVSDTNLNLLYSTLLGSTNSDLAYGIAADATGNAYVVGSTSSGNFPSINTIATNLLTSYVRTNTVGVLATNGFVSQVKWNGSNAYLGYSAIFGGIGNDVATAIALDPAGNAFVTGYATSTGFPVTKSSIFGSLRATNSGGSDAFVIAFNSDASALLYSTYLGGEADDFGYGIAVDSAGSACIVGQTFSTSFPTFNARQTTRNGVNDAFLAKITLGSPTLTASLSGTNFLVSLPPVGELNPNPFSLETSTNLVGTNWVVVTNTPTLINGTNIYKFNPTNLVRFFRFHQ